MQAQLNPAAAKTQLALHRGEARVRADPPASGFARGRLRAAFSFLQQTALERLRNAAAAPVLPAGIARVTCAQRTQPTGFVYDKRRLILRYIALDRINWLKSITKQNGNDFRFGGYELHVSNQPERAMTNSLRSWAAALAIVLGAWIGPCGATIVEIDDAESVSINGVPITFAGQTVGTFPNFQEVTNFLISSGSPTTPDTAIVGWTDFSITGAPQQQFNSPQLLLIKPGTGGSVISDIITLFIQGDDTFTSFLLRMDSDFGDSGLTCTPPCVSLGEATGEFQDISAAALGNSGVSGLTIRVRSDIDVTAVPEPATLLLAVLALAALSASAAWRQRRRQ
jgi:hypothetical protein